MIPLLHRSLLPALALCGLAAAAPAQSTERVSVSTAGVEADLECGSPSINANGRWVAFASAATTLVAGDANGVSDVFVRDRISLLTERASVGMGGVEGNGASWDPFLSTDGRYVAFTSAADNLVGGDVNGVEDVFLHDRFTGTTLRVCLNSIGLAANGASSSASVSGDGRMVAYDSVADNLVLGDGNSVRDVFVRDRTSGATVRVSVNSLGGEANGPSSRPSISSDGRFVAFESDADNLVPNDVNQLRDVFVHDLLTGTTVLASAGLSGAASNGASERASIAASGRFVAFESVADNLVPADANGCADVFVRDTLSGVTTRASVDSSGLEGDAPSHNPFIAAGARYVTFDSEATNLVAGDTNGVTDVFCRDRLRGATTRASLSTSGLEGNGASTEPAISSDCRYVAFASAADGLVAGDINAVTDVFVRDRDLLAAVTVDTIVLSADVFLRTGQSARFSWCGAPPNTPWWMLYSTANLGTTFGGHPFGLGPGISVLTSGTHASTGGASLNTPLIPPAFAGATVYLEVAAQLGADYYESNTVQRIVQ